MRALTLTRRPIPGTLPSTIEMSQLPTPVPRGRQALVRVLASTINIDDIHVAEGTFCGGIPIGPQPSLRRPLIPGSDLAGMVVGAGSHVRSLSIGDTVFGVQMPFRRMGAWAEFCAVDERWLTLKPEEMDFETSAACGVSGLVALSALRKVKPRPGMRVVITGATGGIGAIAVQLARHAGAEVIGVCSPANADRARRLGCSLVLDYHGASWDRGLQAHNAGAIDCVLDTAGGRDIEEAARRVLSRTGRFVTVVGPERFIGDRPLGFAGILAVFAGVAYRIVRSQIRGPRYVLTGPSTSGGVALPQVARAAATGVVPPIDSVVPFQLDAMRQALSRAADHRNHGRIVIRMNPAV